MLYVGTASSRDSSSRQYGAPTAIVDPSIIADNYL